MQEKRPPMDSTASCKLGGQDVRIFHSKANSLAKLFGNVIKVDKGPRSLGNRQLIADRWKPIKKEEGDAARVVKKKSDWSDDMNRALVKPLLSIGAGPMCKLFQVI